MDWSRKDRIKILDDSDGDREDDKNVEEKL